MVCESVECQHNIIDYNHNLKSGFNGNAVGDEMTAIDEEVSYLKRVLFDTRRPLAVRYRALFRLRNMDGNNEDDTSDDKGDNDYCSYKVRSAVECLCSLLYTPPCEHGALLRHEVAFALGQMQNKEAIGALEYVLRNEDEDSIVRHEAAEAIGAIGVDRDRCCALLEEFRSDSGSKEVRETCELVIARFESFKQRSFHHAEGVSENTFEEEEVEGEGNSCFGSVDPAMPLDEEHDKEIVAAVAAAQQTRVNMNRSTTSSSIDDDYRTAAILSCLESILLNEAAPITRRYGALFALRNRKQQHTGSCVSRGNNSLQKEKNEAEAVQSICRALLQNDASSSALLRHEIAYVLGQLQDDTSVDALKKCLANTAEHPMVRHEAAEALGAVATESCIGFLREYANDDEPIVADSCQIALDMLDRKDSFEYLEVDD